MWDLRWAKWHFYEYFGFPLHQRSAFTCHVEPIRGRSLTPPQGNKNALEPLSVHTDHLYFWQQQTKTTT